MWALLMVTRNCFLPGFVAQRLSIFGQMALEMIIEILCVAAQIEHDAPDQRAAGQFDGGGPFAVNFAHRGLGVRHDVAHLFVIFQLSPRISAGIVAAPGDARRTSQHVARDSPILRRPGVAFGSHARERRLFFRHVEMQTRADGSSGTSGSSKREVFGPPSHTEVVIGYGVGQIIGHNAFEIARRMRWPAGKTQLVT